MIVIQMEEGTDYTVCEHGTMHLTRLRKDVADTMLGDDYKSGDPGGFDFPTLCGLGRNLLVMAGPIMTSADIRAWCMDMENCGACRMLAFEALAREAGLGDEGA